MNSNAVVSAAWTCPVCGAVARTETPVEEAPSGPRPPDGWKLVEVPMRLLLVPWADGRKTPVVDGATMLVCPSCVEEVQRFVARMVDFVNEWWDSPYVNQWGRRVAEAYRALRTAHLKRQPVDSPYPSEPLRKDPAP